MPGYQWFYAKMLKGGKKTGERVYDEDSGTMCWEVTGGIRALDELNKAMKHFLLHTK